MTPAELQQHLLADPFLSADPLGRELVPVLLAPALMSSSGYPFLQKPAFIRLRDWVPHILGDGPQVLDALGRIEAAAERAGPEARENLAMAARVVRQMVHTAAVTAPPTLWVLRHVLSVFSQLGISQRLLEGDTITPDSVDGVDPDELRIDLNFLLGRGYVIRQGTGVRASRHQTAQRALAEVGPLPAGRPASLTDPWRRAFGAEALSSSEVALLLDVASSPPRTTVREPGRWEATPEDIELGYRLVPLALGLWASVRGRTILSRERIDGGTLCPIHPELGNAALAVLQAAGALDASGCWTSPGRRLFDRGIGALGIIEAYHAYMDALPVVLREGRGAVHVSRGANITASQEANRKTFLSANKSLDRFIEDTGFELRLFIEHAIGRGEATRQRFERSGDESVRYFGADLEDPAIDAAQAEQAAGFLPSGMGFVRNADIGEPSALVQAIEGADLATEGGVMMVGNGFHEIRNQSDERMVDVFRAYEEAGLILLFTEENALSVDDLLETAWNTYHPGFRYVHERSGQGLRPAETPAPSSHSKPLPASWTECATRAGYVRATDYCSRSRTIYPYPRSNGYNPCISTGHFFVPGRIARALGLEDS